MVLILIFLPSFQHKSALVENRESIMRKQQVFQTMDPFLVRLSASLAVSQSGECPFHHSLKYRASTDLDTKDDKAGKPEENLVEMPVLAGTVYYLTVQVEFFFFFLIYWLKLSSILFFKILKTWKSVHHSVILVLLDGCLRMTRDLR